MGMMEEFDPIEQSIIQPNGSKSTAVEADSQPTAKQIRPHPYTAEMTPEILRHNLIQNELAYVFFQGLEQIIAQMKFRAGQDFREIQSMLRPLRHRQHRQRFLESRNTQ